MILQTASQRRHGRFPVDDLSSGQGRFVGAIFNDQGRQRGALPLGQLLALSLAFGVVRIDPNDHLAGGDGSCLARGLLIELGPCAQRLALGASRPRFGEQKDPGPSTSRAHPDGKPRLLCVVQIELRLARRQRGCTYRRVSELQVVRRHFGSETLLAVFHRLCPYSLCPGTRRGRPKKRITNRSLHVPSSVVPHGKIREGHGRGIQNVARPAMASYGPTWPKIPALQGLLEQNYGLIRLARVYGLWFTRERSKVRSLVRPPSKAP